MCIPASANQIKLRSRVINFYSKSHYCSYDTYKKSSCKRMLPRIAVLCVVSRSLVNSSALVPVSQCKTRCVHPRLSQASSGQRLVAGFLFVSNSLLFLQFSPQTQLQNKRRSSDRLHDTQTHYILTRNPNPAWVTGRAATRVSVPRQV